MSIGNLILVVNNVTVSYLICYNSLLQNATNVTIKCDSYFITKCVSFFITKCGNYYKLRQLYYKIQQLLQNATFITNCDSAVEMMIGKYFINNGDSIPIVTTTDKTVNSFVKGYRVYKGLWKRFTNEELTTTMETDNVVDKQDAVCVKRSNVIAGHLPHGKNGIFAKMIFSQNR